MFDISIKEVIFEADVVIGGADYHFIETKLLEANHRTSEDEVACPCGRGCLLYPIFYNDCHV
jgi:hypothetical protein